MTSDQFPYGFTWEDLQLPSPQEPFTPQISRRYEDMSRHGELQLLVEEDGDVIVTVYPDPEANQFGYGTSIQFCTSTSGGGQSPRVLRALLALKVAIDQDNAENPQRRGTPEMPSGVEVPAVPKITWQIVAGEHRATVGSSILYRVSFSAAEDPGDHSFWIIHSGEGPKVSGYVADTLEECKERIDAAWLLFWQNIWRAPKRSAESQ